MKYASFKMWIADKYHYKDGYAIGLVVRKDTKRKVMAFFEKLILTYKDTQSYRECHLLQSDPSYD